ncbi:MAG: hypothetical protein HDS46_01600 [Bacteroides sp.]|nr:hypothetical protein [Bacteroides sp.]
MPYEYSEFAEEFTAMNWSYKFPREEYRVIGDVAEIEKVINAEGYINIDLSDLLRVVSKGAVNYVATGSGVGDSCVADAINSAIRNLPVDIMLTSRVLIDLWLSKDLDSKAGVLSQLTDSIKKIGEDIDIFWGIVRTDTLVGRQAEATLIASGCPDEYEKFRALALNPPYIDWESVYRVEVHCFMNEMAADESEVEINVTQSFVYLDLESAECRLRQIVADETLSDKLFAVYIFQLPIGMDVADGLYQRLWVYDRCGLLNGQSHCSSLLEDIDHCSGKYRGHEANTIRFKAGDIVEAYDRQKGVLHPVEVIGLPMTIEQCFRRFGNAVKKCSDEGLPTDAAYDNYWLRADDDFYFVVDAQGNTLETRTYDIFPPSQQRFALLREELTKRYREAIKCGTICFRDLYNLL